MQPEKNNGDLDSAELQIDAQDLFANPSAEEKAALAWLYRNLERDSAKKISDDIKTWAGELPHKYRKDQAKTQDIRIPRRACKNKKELMGIVRKHFVKKITDERAGQTAFAGFRVKPEENTASKPMQTPS